MDEEWKKIVVRGLRGLFTDPENCVVENSAFNFEGSTFVTVTVGSKRELSAFARYSLFHKILHAAFFGEGGFFHEDVGVSECSPMLAGVTRANGVNPFRDEEALASLLVDAEMILAENVGLGFRLASTAPAAAWVKCPFPVFQIAGSFRREDFSLYVFLPNAFTLTISDVESYRVNRNHAEEMSAAFSASAFPVEVDGKWYKPVVKIEGFSWTDRRED